MGHALIVEDTADAAKQFAALLAAEGYSVATARSVAEARIQIASQAPDRVLLFMRLPAPGGGEPGVGESPSAAPAAAAQGAVEELSFKVGSPLAQLERQMILGTLRHFDNHKERTAAALGVSLKTLYNKLKAYNGAAAAGNAGKKEAGEEAAQLVPGGG